MLFVPSSSFLVSKFTPSYLVYSVFLMKTSPKATPNKLQLVRLVKLAKELARIGGKVVDAQK